MKEELKSFIDSLNEKLNKGKEKSINQNNSYFGNNQNFMNNIGISSIQKLSPPYSLGNTNINPNPMNIGGSITTNNFGINNYEVNLNIILIKFISSYVLFLEFQTSIPKRF